MRPAPGALALCLLATGCAGVRAETTRVGVPVPPWTGPVRMSATPPTERAHQVAFFEAECPGACVSRLLERFRRVVPLYGGNLGYVDRIGIRHEGTVYWHGTVMAMGDGNEEPEPWETLHESVVTRLEGRAFLVFGGRR